MRFFKDRPWFKFYPAGFTFTLDYPQITLYECLDFSAKKYPEKDAIIFYGRRISYYELKDYADKLATFLSKEGIKKGDKVAIYMPNSPLWVISYFGILRANAVVVPINPMLQGGELEYLLKDSEAKLVITTYNLYLANRSIFERLKIKVIAGNISDYFPEDPELPLPELKEEKIPDDSGFIPWSKTFSGNNPPLLESSTEDIAMIPYTAGSTSTPKGCIHTHSTIISNVVSAAYWERVSAASVQLSALPFFHVTGLVHCLLAPIYTGSTMVILIRWDRKTALDAIERYKVTHWISIATMIFDILSDPEIEQRDLSSLRMAGGGGMPMPKAVAEKWERITGIKYMEGYGLTETISQTHMNPLENPRYGSLGIPDFNVDALVIDPDTGKPLNPGETGELVVYGPEIFKGYWNKPEETEKAFIDIEGKRYFRTGDIVYMDNDGFFYIVDRLKRMINRAGFKVWPAEVESKLYEHPAVQEAVVIGTPDPRVGEEVKALIVLKPEYKGKVKEDDIINWAKGKMASYKYPKKIEFVETLPRSGAGKIDWRLLQEIEKKKAKKGGN